MKKTTLRSRYMAMGGNTSPLDESKMGLSSALGLGASLGTGLIDSFGKGDTRVGGALSGGLSLGAKGLAFGPIGGAVGFGVGAVTGLIGANRKKELQEREDRLLKSQQTQASLDAGQAAIAGDDSLIYGRRKAEYFANGGTLGDPKPATSIKTPRGNVVTDADLAKTKAATNINWETKEAYGEWIDKFAEPVKEPSASTVTYPYGRRGETMTQDEWDYSRTKRKYPDVYADKRQGTDNFAPGESFANEIRNDIKEYRAKQATAKTKMANGGTLQGNYDKWRNSLPKNLQSTEDYDLQGYYKKYGDKAIGANGHLTDEFKKPNHPTFSNESIYYNDKTRNKAGFWTDNDVYIPFDDERPSYDEKNNRMIKFTSFEKASGKKMTNGGSLNKLNSSTVEVEGNTHAQGGVQIPGAEVEDGETISNGFVFSDKLGFSKLHKPIAKALGKLEKKINNPINAKTTEILKKKEQALSLQQEYYKQQNGIPSDLDNI